MFFDLNGDQYEWYEDPEHADRVDVLVLNHIHNGREYDCRLPLFLDIKHNFDDQVKLLDKRSSATPDRYTVTNALDVNINNPQILFNDFLFNRTKSYYLGYNWNPLTKKWYYTNEQEYVIPEHNLVKQKIFVAPNRPQPQTPYRNRLVDLLVDSKLGYTNLVSKSEVIGDISLQELESLRNWRKLGYSPPHNLYYQNTFISIVSETIEIGTSFAATEKTFDPLIKGHFVLPFGIHKFVEHLKSHYDFRFPDFIDYSYDNIFDAEKRFQCYTNEVKRLLEINLDDWDQHWVNNQKIREYNQNIFHNRPYHKVDLIRLLRI